MRTDKQTNMQSGLSQYLVPLSRGVRFSGVMYVYRAFVATFKPQVQLLAVLLSNNSLGQAVNTHIMVM